MFSAQPKLACMILFEVQGNDISSPFSSKTLHFLSQSDVGA